MSTKAYSYIRISSLEQRKGHGEQRQLEAAQAYAEKHGLELDDSLRDLGKSGYHGDHVKTGALGRFLELVATGKIAVGSYLLVENLDRLSRQTPIDAQAQFIALLQAGIRIVTLQDGQIYERGRDFTQMIISLTIMSRSHEESARKSYNSKKNNDANRRDMLAGKPRFYSGCVYWIDQTRIEGSKDFKFTLNDHAKTVRRIFELADQGVGSLSIARLLNESRTPCLQLASAKWWNSTIIKILKNETAIGTLHLYETVDGKSVPHGEPIKNYYPAAVSEELFWRVQRNRNAAPAAGRKGKTLANLFLNITRCSHCGGTLVLNKSSKYNTKYYRCQNRYQSMPCDGPAKMYPYEKLEDAILDHVTDFYHDSRLGNSSKSVSRDALVEQARIADSELAELEKRRKNAMLISEMADDDQTRADYLARYRELRVEIEQRKAKSNEAHMALKAIDDQSEKLVDVSDMIASERKLWETGSDQEIFVSRAKVAQSIRRFVSQIQVDFEQQNAMVYVAGYTRRYLFTRTGELSTVLNGVKMPFSEVEKVMRMDNATDAQIAQAKEAHAILAAVR